MDERGMKTDGEKTSMAFRVIQGNAREDWELSGTHWERTGEHPAARERTGTHREDREHREQGRYNARKKGTT